jgi:beta-phosphoglucomutase
MDITTCIFDLDGVIVDTAKYHFLASRRLANELGFDFDEHANEQLKGVGRMESLDIILSWGGVQLSADEKTDWAARKNDWYLELANQMDPSEILDGALDFLEDVKTQGKLIALGSSSKNAKTILDLIGLGDYFDAVVDGNDIVRTKPDPEVFLLCAQALGQDPRHCVVFEDAQSGVEAALAGGFFAVGIGQQTALKQAHLVVPGFSGWTWKRMESVLLNSSKK